MKVPYLVARVPALELVLHRAFDRLSVNPAVVEVEVLARVQHARRRPAALELLPAAAPRGQDEQHGARDSSPHLVDSEADRLLGTLANLPEDLRLTAGRGTHVRRPPHTHTVMEIIAKTLTGRTVQLEAVELSQTVADIKRQIEAKEGTPADRQRLVFRGHTLEDERTLSHYELEADEPLVLVRRVVDLAGAPPTDDTEEQRKKLLRAAVLGQDDEVLRQCSVVP